MYVTCKKECGKGERGSTVQEGGFVEVWVERDDSVAEERDGARERRRGRLECKRSVDADCKAKQPASMQGCTDDKAQAGATVTR